MSYQTNRIIEANVMLEVFILFSYWVTLFQAFILVYMHINLIFGLFFSENPLRFLVEYFCIIPTFKNLMNLIGTSSVQVRMISDLQVPSPSW